MKQETPFLGLVFNYSVKMIQFRSTTIFFGTDGNETEENCFFGKCPFSLWLSLCFFLSHSLALCLALSLGMSLSFVLILSLSRTHSLFASPFDSNTPPPPRHDSLSLSASLLVFFSHSLSQTHSHCLLRSLSLSLLPLSRSRSRSFIFGAIIGSVTTKVILIRRDHLKMQNNNWSLSHYLGDSFTDESSDECFQIHCLSLSLSLSLYLSIYLSIYLRSYRGSTNGFHRGCNPWQVVLYYF